MLTPTARMSNRIEKASWINTSFFQLEVSLSSSIRRNSGRKHIQQWRIHSFRGETISNSRNRPHVFSNLPILPVIILLRAFLECRVWRTTSQGMMHLNHVQPYAYRSTRIIIGPRAISQTKDWQQANIRRNKNKLNPQKMSAFPLSCRMNLGREEATDREWVSMSLQ